MTDPQTPATALLRGALSCAMAISRRYEGQEAALWAGWIEADLRAALRAALASEPPALTDPQTPATEAGRRLLEWFGGPMRPGEERNLSKAILAIEAEARADALREAATFAIHTPFCRWVQRGQECDCGFVELFR